MKQLFSTLLLSIILNSVYSQTVTPVQTGEFCPNTEYTITVSIPKPFQSIIGNGGCSVTQAPQAPVGSTFTFKGKFGDANQKQWFRITYTDLSFYDIEFKKIKSLFYSTSCAQVPNQSTVTVPRCQIVNIPITVPSVQWGTNFESPTLCFGSISSFEYQIPNGWSISGQPSNGNNWIQGGSSVTVTSDLANGVNGVILVRPRNTCASGLQNGQTPGQIPITRPEPTMSLSPSGNQAFICANSNKTFTLNGLPANANVTSWTTSDPSLATVPSPSTGSSVIVTNAGGNGSVVLTANISQCSFTYTRTVTINLGTFVPAFYNISSNYVSTSNNQFQYYTNPFPYGLGQVYQPKNQNVQFYTVIDNSFITNPSWSVTGTYSLFYQSPNTANLYMTTPNSGSYTRNTATLRLLANSSCGNIDQKYIFEAIVNGSSFRMTASPNPVKGNINVKIAKIEDTTNNRQFFERSVNNKTTAITKLYLYNVNTNALIRQWSYQETEATSYRLNIIGVKSGYYILKMERDNKTTTTKIFVQ